ncbi:MAG: hypothetical protein K8R46_09285 [Pirellulales bacterium]|nr:hypothetical protein [Pirellulales bacterium]
MSKLIIKSLTLTLLTLTLLYVKSRQQDSPAEKGVRKEDPNVKVNN